jgi:hypothetical protein
MKNFMQKDLSKASDIVNEPSRAEFSLKDFIKNSNAIVVIPLKGLESGRERFQPALSLDSWSHAIESAF